MESAAQTLRAIPLDPFRIAGPCVYSTSGGRTSAMLYGLAREARGGEMPPDHWSLFANTGKELPETLDFVRELTVRWGAPTWVEYVPKRGGTRVDFREVTYETASRRGEPFEAMMDFERYMPNPSARLCTKLLKVLTMQAWVFAKTGLKPGEYVEVIGIRADEAHRAVKLRAEWPERLFSFPLITAGVTKPDVLAWWAAQPFDLALGPNESNCDLCFLRGHATRVAIMQKRPEAAQWWIDQETTRGHRFRKGVSYARLAQFAKNQVRLNVLDDDGSDPTDLGGCACTD